MNNITNTSLTVIATGLIALGVNTIASDLLSGVIEIVLGVAIYAIYEFTPSK